MRTPGGRRREPRIIDIQRDPRRQVSLGVAASFLGVDPRTLLRRIEDGRIAAVRDGRVYQILLTEIRRYDEQRRTLGIDLG